MFKRTPAKDQHQSSHEAQPAENNVSRRGFLKRLSQMGAALGLGVAGVAATTTPAHACTPPYYEYKNEYGACGSCTEGGVNKRVRRHYRRECKGCPSGEICGSWVLESRTCVQCA
ncbi:MAG: twin-arginine translocation signal domain-containing protein [Chloroflexi bacterium]|nr:twin-arginine translocation signal domain-containing protein [Chloroflexota bacterium]